ncbi:MAG: IclR family transcriptional regulator [Gammaproteobacteria bacterium]|nr:IclR family transcriptional regulator [Gammaproteobacteria bacterium]
MDVRARDTGRVKSVEQGFLVLRALADTARAQTLKALAAAAGMSPAKAHRYLASLVRTGLAQQDATTGHYALGPEAVQMSLAALGQLDVVREAAAAMASLRDALDLTVLLSVWGNSGATIVRMLEAQWPVRANVRIGFTMPLLSSATGLAFAAWLPRSRVAPLLARELRSLAAGTRAGVPRNSARAQALLARVRRQGVSRVRGALVAGINSVAAPVFEHPHRLAGVLTLVGAAESIDIRLEGAAVRLLQAQAETMSRRLGRIAGASPPA